MIFKHRYEVVFKQEKVEETIDFFESMDSLLQYLSSEEEDLFCSWGHRLEDLAVQKILITETVEKEISLRDLWEDTWDRREELKEEQALLEKTGRYRQHLELLKEFGS